MCRGVESLLAPAGTPKPIVDRLYAALQDAVKDPSVRERFTAQGAEPVSSEPEELTRFIVRETAKLRDIIRKAGIDPM